MNKLLLKVFQLILLCVPFFYGNQLQAQCACEGGVEPNALEHFVVLNATNQSNTTINFPKFDPSLGTLNCVRLDDTLSIVSTTGIRNYEPTETEYIFDLSVNTKVEGPALSRINSKSLEYGPDMLGANGSATDTINYGPDSIYNNWPSTRTNSSNMTPYLGSTGTVSFAYTIGGGVIAIGGVNYNAQVRTTTWGVFKLTYYWCNNTVLASGIRNFTAIKSDDGIFMKWEAPENLVKNNFEIQISKDGTAFSTIGTGANTIAGSSTEYSYQYQPDQPLNSKLYIRVRYKNGGRDIFSSMKLILPDEQAAGSINAYPNPAVKTVSIAFEGMPSGNYQIELFNQTGQAVFRSRMQVKENSRVKLPMNVPPPPGLYYLKARQEGQAKVYSGKLLFTR